MPEYLAPGVYVEEVDTGSKPIEGVSTSTAGMLGVTERGPVNVPILITSYGEYMRWFGGLLSEELYGEHRFLPHAVEGFFTNGGKRVFVTRILSTDLAATASAFVFDSTPPAAATTALLCPITSAVPDRAYLVDLPAGMAVTTPRAWLQIGQGGDVEFVKLEATPGGETDVTLDLPLVFPHAAGEDVERHAAPAGGNFDSGTTLNNAATKGTRTIDVAAAGSIAVGNFIQIGTVAPAGTRQRRPGQSAAPRDGLDRHEPGGSR
jgi:phage tail sheath protein FI